MPEDTENSADLKYLNALQKIPGVGPRRTKILLAYFETGENIWKADLGSLSASKVGEKLAERIFLERSGINPEEEWERLERENIQVLTLNNPDYPKLLAEIPNPPFLLYIRGAFDFNRQPAIAIVGSRKYTAYGAQAARGFARDLATAGITVISGLALGIDAFAHRGALEAGEKTVAVL
ncbi:MAG: DNA-processing protein DprA, partial [Candidatus Pacebacteria bacterium]|nr:DNA-processing protein DprA [Candidatus Paceibacterota bacterium]